MNMISVIATNCYTHAQQVIEVPVEVIDNPETLRDCVALMLDYDYFRINDVDGLWLSTSEL